MFKDIPRLPIICAFAGAILFNLGGYFLESKLIAETSFEGVLGGIVGALIGLAIHKARVRKA